MFVRDPLVEMLLIARRARKPSPPGASSAPASISSMFAWTPAPPRNSSPGRGTRTSGIFLFSSNAHRSLQRRAPRGLVQTTPPIIAPQPLVQRRALSGETRAVAGVSAPCASPPPHAAPEVRLELHPSERAPCVLVPGESAATSVVAEASFGEVSASENAFRGGDVAVDVAALGSEFDEEQKPFSGEDSYGEDCSSQRGGGKDSSPGNDDEWEPSGGAQAKAEREADRGAIGGDGGAATKDPSKMRLSRRIARSGVASRREAERLVEEGAVRVNGETVQTPALSVGPKDAIKVKGRSLPALEGHEPSLWMVHKLRNELVTRNDPAGRPTIFDRLFKLKLPDTLMPIGRLDFNTEGLLLLTNDGDLARKMELPSSGVVRTYSVRVYGNITEEKLRAMRNGSMIDGVRYKGMFVRVEGGGGKGREGRNAWLTIQCTEGKNRQIRKICKHLCLKVSRLARIRFGPFSLGKVRPGGVARLQIPRSFLTRLEEGKAGGMLGSGVNAHEMGGPGPGVAKRRQAQSGASVGSSPPLFRRLGEPGRGGGQRIRKGVGAPMSRGDNAPRDRVQPIR